MPTVPTYRTYQTFQAAPAANPLATRRNTSGEDIVQNLASITGQVKKTFDDIDRANLVNYNNSLMQARQELLNDPDSGYLGTQNLDAINGQKTVQGQWADRVKESMAGLPKHLQQHAQQMAAEQTLSFDQAVDQHVRTQKHNYMDTVEQQSQLAHQNQALLDYANPVRIEQIADDAAATAGMSAQRKGLPVDMVEQQTKSAIRQAAVMRLAQDDPIAATQRYYDLLDQGKLTGQSAAALDQVLKPVVRDAQSRNDANAIINGGTLDGGAGKDIDDQIIQVESGGDADARNPSSSATGAGQFIDSTWLNTIKRSRPDLAAGKSDAELLALRSDKVLSREMVSAYRQENQQRLTAAGVPASPVNLYAAHHFGSGGAISFAKAADDAPMSSILTPSQMAANHYLQGKTKAEAVAIWSSRGLSAGSSANFAAPAASEAEAMQRAQMIADPQRRQAVVAQLRTHYGIEDMQKAEAKQALSERINQAIANNTNPSASLSQLVSPVDYAQIQRNGDLAAFENYRQAVLTGRLIHDNPVLADTLFRQSTLDPNAFSKVDLGAYADQLSSGTLESLTNRQSSIKSHDASSMKDWATDQERVDQGLTMLGLQKPPGEKKGQKQTTRERLAAEYQLAYQNAMQSFMQKNGGKKPTPEQADTLMRASAKLFAERMRDGAILIQDEDGNPTGGMYSNAAKFQLQISKDDRDKLIGWYRGKYGTTPTDAWVVHKYIEQKAKQGGAQ